MNSKMKNIHLFWGVVALLTLISIPSVSGCYGAYCYTYEYSTPGYYRYEYQEYYRPQPSWSFHMSWGTYYPRYYYPPHQVTYYYPSSYYVNYAYPPYYY